MATYGVKLARSAPLSLPRHPAASDDDFEAWCAAEAVTRPLAVDLFSGAGGLGLGVEQAGWRVVAAVDNDPHSIATHLANFPGKALNLDMFDQDQVEALVGTLAKVPIDLIVGGPPCQPFSRAGRSKIRSLLRDNIWSGPDNRKDLWQSFVRVVEGVMPRAVILENVPDMAIADEIRTVREIASRLEDLDYEVEYRLLDAWRHGVPQHRKRLFIQARRDGHTITWPAPSDTRPTVRQAIHDLPRLGQSIGSREMISTGGNEVIFDHMTRPVRPDDVEAFSLMNEKTLYSDLPEDLRRYRADTFRDKYKRLGWDDLSRTITAHIAKDGYWYIHPEEHRTLTVREAARIQTFPDDFRFAGTRSHAFRQIGNAVPPRLSREVASQLLANDETPRTQPSRQLLRNALTEWALQARATAWWRYPGARMSEMAAYLYAYLDLNRVDDVVARAVVEAANGGVNQLRHLVKSAEVELSSTSRRRLTQWLNNPATDDLTGARESRYRALRGEDSLFTNQRVAANARQILALDTSGELLTGSRLEVALLIGWDNLSPLRMTALDNLNAVEIDKVWALNS